jgi:hypothetical protein
MKRIIVLILVLALGIGGIAGMAMEAEQAVETGAEPKPPDEPVETPPEDEPDDEPYDEKPAEPSVTFSHTDTFYDKAISVTLTGADPGAEIYFTIDGSAPSENSRLYKEPINITLPNGAPSPTTIKAVAIKDGEQSEVVNKSYLVGRDVFTRFTPGTYVFILSACPYELLDRDHGIFVDGIIRREYRANGGRLDNPTAPANYNLRGRAGERDMFVETYDHEGNLLIHQAAGVRVHGGWSRAENQKSLRLFARREYGKGKFSHPFFEHALDSDGQQIEKFDRILLRNNGNDRNEAAIRDELSQELSRQAGFPDAQKAEPAAVFLNGRYYGFSWMKEVHCTGRLVSMYGGKKDNYQIVSNREQVLSSVKTLEELHGRDLSHRSRTQFVRVEETGEIYKIDGLMTNPHWVALEDDEFKAHEEWYNLYSLADAAVKAGPGKSRSFTNDRVFNEFSSHVDIDNFMLFYAIQVFIDNKDWPGNNYKAWKYYPGEEEAVTNAFHDGKWRFLMYDMEFAWGLYGRATFADQTLLAVLGVRGSHMGGQSVMLQAVLQREDMQEKFVNTMCDLISGAFSSENALSTLENLIDVSFNELNAAINANTLSWWASPEAYEEKRDQVRNFAGGRPDFMLNMMRRHFDVDEAMYSVSVQGAAAGAQAWLNSRRVLSGETAQTAYFTHYGVDLRADIYPGYEFSHWEVNGTEHRGKNLRIDASMADSDGNVYVTLHAARITEGLPFLVDELDTGSGADWITLYNPNSSALSTRGLFLSDNAEDLKKWSITPTNVQPGETLKIVMRNNSTQDALRRPQANFSLKAGETLFLTDADENIHASVLIPNLRRGQTMKRLENGRYIIIDPPPET